MERFVDVLYVFDSNMLQTVSLKMPHLDTFLESFPVYEDTINYVTLKHNHSDFLPNKELPKYPKNSIVLKLI